MREASASGESLRLLETPITTPATPSQPARAATLSVAFLLTGVGIALLGATLPVLLKQWGMSDRGGGILLFLAWGGSTSGALLCRGSLRLSAAGGLMLTALSTLILAVVDRRAALPVFAFYGLGLGIAMTAITMIVSRRSSDLLRAREIMRLNLIWSIGALLAPALATHALRFTRAGGLYATMSLVFCMSAVALWFRGKDVGDSFSSPNENLTDSKAVVLRTAPISLYAMAGLAVGVESAIGGWLTTYSGRTAHTELVSLSATTAFWAGLLLSRALHSLSRLGRLQPRPMLIVHAAITTVATAMLLAAPQSPAFLPSALLAGFGLGPLYPRVQALVVGHYRPRPVFIIAGVNAAALPWLTGTLSQAAHSLRAGLILPSVGAAALLALMILSQRHPHTSR